MYNTVPAEIQFFLTCVFAGFVVAFLYDIFRISRRIVSVNDVVVNVEDLIFFSLAAIILFYAAYLRNSGEIRWQWFIGGAFGIGIYIFIIRNRFLNISMFLVSLFNKLFGIVIKIMFFPIKIIFRIFRKPISVVAWHTGRGFRKIRRVTQYGKTKIRVNMKSVYGMLRKR